MVESGTAAFGARQAEADARSCLSLGRFPPIAVVEAKWLIRKIGYKDLGAFHAKLDQKAL